MPEMTYENQNAHDAAKVAVQEQIASAINYIRETHGEEILDKQPNLLSETVRALSITYSAHVMAASLDSIASQLKHLGNGNAATQMGAIEGLGLVFKESLEDVSSALNSIAESNRDK